MLKGKLLEEHTDDRGDLDKYLGILCLNFYIDKNNFVFLIPCLVQLLIKVRVSLVVQWLLTF